MRGFPAKTASRSISQMPRHYWVSAICDAVVLVIGILLLLSAFISAVRAISIRPRLTLFLDAVVDEKGQFRKYDSAFHAQGLLFCATYNTTVSNHIAEFVKGAHILTA